MYLYEYCMLKEGIRGWGGGGVGNLRKHVVYDTLIIFYKDEHDQVSFYGH